MIQIAVAGFCPAFITVESAIQGMAVGLVISFAISMIVLLTALARRLIAFDVYMLFMTIICATLTALLSLILAAYFYGLYLSMRFYLALAVINGFIFFTRIEESCFRNGPIASLKHGLIVTMTIVAVFGIFGLVRELLINAAVFRQFDFDLGQFRGDASGLVLFENFNSFALFEKSAGALLILALLVAAFNFIAGRRKSLTTGA